jgi:hypothetical protein
MHTKLGLFFVRTLEYVTYAHKMSVKNKSENTNIFLQCAELCLHEVLRKNQGPLERALIPVPKPLDKTGWFPI